MRGAVRCVCVCVVRLARTRSVSDERRPTRLFSEVKGDFLPVENKKGRAGVDARPSATRHGYVEKIMLTHKNSCSSYLNCSALMLLHTCRSRARRREGAPGAPELDGAEKRALPRPGPSLGTAPHTSLAQVQSAPRRRDTGTEVDARGVAPLVPSSSSAPSLPGKKTASIPAAKQSAQKDGLSAGAGSAIPSPPAAASPSVLLGKKATAPAAKQSAQKDGLSEGAGSATPSPPAPAAASPSALLGKKATAPAAKQSAPKGGVQAAALVKPPNKVPPRRTDALYKEWSVEEVNCHTYKRSLQRGARRRSALACSLPRAHQIGPEDLSNRGEIK